MKTYLEFVNESLTDKLYHFTYIPKIYNILKSNEILLTPVFGTSADNDINDKKLYALSLTSSRSSDIGFAASLPDKRIGRITFDGRKLNHNFKSKRVDYWQRPKDPKDPMYKQNGIDRLKQVSRQDELEDRIIVDNDLISNAIKYIKSIDVLIDINNNTDKEYLGNIKRLCKENNIPFHAYDSKKYFNSNFKEKSVDVEEQDTKIENRDRDDNYSFKILASLLLVKDEKLQEKIFKYIDDHEIDIKKDLVQKTKEFEYDLKYLTDDYSISDKNASLQSYIHNNKSTTNKKMRYIIKEIGLDMKKHDCVTIKDYIKYKVWKGKKTNLDFKKELIDFVDIEIDKAIKDEFSKLDYRYYDNEGYGHDNFGSDKKLLKFYDTKISELKKYYKEKIDDFDDSFKYTYTISSSNVSDSIKLFSDESYTNLTKEYDNIDAEEIRNPMRYIIYDVSASLSDKIDKIKEEKRNRWN